MAPTERAKKRKGENIEVARRLKTKTGDSKTVEDGKVSPAPPSRVEHPSHGKTPGTIFVFGDGSCGQIGLGEDVIEKLRPSALQLSDNLQVLQVCCGGMHTVAVADDGSVWSWGVNDEGALGRETAGELWEKSPLRTGKPRDSYVPHRVAMPEGSRPVVQVSAGDSHTAALDEAGVVYAWGTFRSDSGVMGFGASTRIQLAPVAVLELAKDRVVKISSGADHVAALTERRAVYTWGSGLQGQLGRVGARVVEQAKEGSKSALAALLTPTPVRVMQARGASRVADLACGTYCTFLWSTDGKIFAWGLNNYGQLAHKSQVLWAPTPLAAFKGTPVAWVRSGQHHSLVCTAGGRLMSMGRPTYGRLGRSDVDVASDEPTPEPKEVQGLDGVEVAGASAGLAVSGAFSRDPAGLWMWGFGTNGQLAKGDDDGDETLPARVKQTKGWNARRVLQLEIGGQHVAILCAPPEPASAGGGQDS